MDNNDAHAVTATQLLAPGAKANTAAATSSLVDVSEYDGALVAIQSVGAITAGSITGKLQHSPTNTTADCVDLTGGSFAALTTSQVNTLEKLVIPLNAISKYVRYVGTIATGPADVGVELVARKPTA